MDRRRARDVLGAAAVAGVVSGLPSTAHAVLTGRSPLGAARAAGSLLGRPGMARGLVAHGGISLLWAAVLAALLPRRRTAWWGAVAGLAIAVVDLGIVGRRIRPIRSLPVVAQVLDHAAFGAAAGAVLARRGRGGATASRSCGSAGRGRSRPAP